MSTKKIIAREFLFLLGTSITLIIVLIISTLISDSLNSENYSLNQKIDSLSQTENTPYRLRVYNVFKEELKQSNDKLRNEEIFINELNKEEFSDSIFDLIKKRFKGNVTITNTEFRKKISNDTESKEYLIKIQNLNEEIRKNSNSPFYSFGNDEIGFIVSLFFILFFLLRYLFYATSWSIKQLKN